MLTEIKTETIIYILKDFIGIVSYGNYNGLIGFTGYVLGSIGVMLS